MREKGKEGEEKEGSRERCNNVLMLTVECGGGREVDSAHRGEDRRKRRRRERCPY